MAAPPEQDSLFRGLLDAYINRTNTHPLAIPDARGLPPRDWPGWAAICEDFAVTADYPAFRVRQAVKLVIEADTAFLSAKDIDFAVVEAALEGILLGTVAPEDLPYTQAPEEAALAAAAAGDPVIILAQALPRRKGRGPEWRYLVAFPGQSQDAGEEFTKVELKKMFPDRWKDMIKAWNEMKAVQEAGGAAGAGGAPQGTADETATAGQEDGDVEMRDGGAGGRPEDHQASVVEGHQQDDLAGLLGGGGEGAGLHMPAFPAAMAPGNAPFSYLPGPGLRPMAAGFEDPSVQFIPAHGQHLAAGGAPPPLPEPMAFSQPYHVPAPVAAAPPPRPLPQQQQFVALEVPVQAGIWAPEPVALPVVPAPLPPPVQPLQQRQPIVAAPQPQPTAPKQTFVSSMIAPNMAFREKKRASEEPEAAKQAPRRPAGAKPGPPPSALAKPRQSRQEVTEDDIMDLLGGPSGGTAPPLVPTARPKAAPAPALAAVAKKPEARKEAQGVSRDPRLRGPAPPSRKPPTPASAAKAAATTPGSALGKRAPEAAGPQTKRQKTGAQPTPRREQEKEEKAAPRSAAASPKVQPPVAKAPKEAAQQQKEEDAAGPRRSRRVQLLEKEKGEPTLERVIEKKQQRAKEVAATARVEAARAAQTAEDPVKAAAAEHEAAAAVAAAAAGGSLDVRLGPAQWEGVRIAGAKTYPDREGIHVVLRWPDDYQMIVPSRDLQMPGRAHCMRSLIAFFESKIKKREKTEVPGDGGGDVREAAAAAVEEKREEEAADAEAATAKPGRRAQQKKKSGKK